MNFHSARKSRFVFTAVVVAAVGLALAGCGRKGPLDAPPGAAIATPEPASTSSDYQERSLLGDPSQSGSVNSLPAAKGAKKRIPLDVLLD